MEIKLVVVVVVVVFANLSYSQFNTRWGHLASEKSLKALQL